MIDSRVFTWFVAAIMRAHYTKVLGRNIMKGLTKELPKWNTKSLFSFKNAAGNYGFCALRII